MPKTLITGGTGLIGYHLASALYAQGVDLRLMHRSEQPPKLWANWDVEAVVGDLNNPRSLAAAVVGCDHVYHAAACISTSQRDASLVQSVNVGGTRAMVREAAQAGVCRFVNVSSIAAMGINGTGPTTEAEPYNHPAGYLYNESKRDAESVAHADPSQMVVVSVRPSLVVGPGPFRRGSISKLIHVALRTGLPVAPVGGVNIVDVDDVVSTLIAGMHYGEDGDRFLAVGHNIKTRQLMDTICDLLEKPKTRFSLPHNATSRLAMLLKLWCSLGLPGQPPFQALAVSGTNMYYNDDWTRDRLKLSEPTPLHQTLQKRIDWERSQP